MNLAALDSIAKVMNMDRPSALQGRIAGSKGVWCRALITPDLDSTSFAHSNEPCIEITDSQRKIHVDYQSTEWPARLHRIFCLVKEGRASDSVSLNKQIILCLAHGGCSADIFQHLLQSALDKALYPFMHPEHPDSLFLIWSAIERAGGASSARARQYLAGQARAHGFGQKFGKDEDEELDLTAVFKRDPCSGYPESFATSALELLGSGFLPSSCPKLFSDLHETVRVIISRITAEYHIPLPDGAAAEAMVIPGMCNPLHFI
jgi:RNA-dependent RNA polymerase